MNRLIYIILYFMNVSCKTFEGVRKRENLYLENLLLSATASAAITAMHHWGIRQFWSSNNFPDIRNPASTPKSWNYGFLLNVVVWISLLVKNFTAYLCLVIKSSRLVCFTWKVLNADNCANKSSPECQNLAFYSANFNSSVFKWFLWQKTSQFLLLVFNWADRLWSLGRLGIWWHSRQRWKETTNTRYIYDRPQSTPISLLFGQCSFELHLFRFTSISSISWVVQCLILRLFEL